MSKNCVRTESSQHHITATTRAPIPPTTKAAAFVGMPAAAALPDDVLVLVVLVEAEL